MTQKVRIIEAVGYTKGAIRRTGPAGEAVLIEAGEISDVIEVTAEELMLEFCLFKNPKVNAAKEIKEFVDTHGARFAEVHLKNGRVYFLNASMGQVQAAMTNLSDEVSTLNIDGITDS
jgi:hypothetical protein